MPRRKPKHSIPKGTVLNPNGRPKGSVNQINEQIREAFAMLLAGSADKLQDWLDRAAAKDPVKALDLFTRISERFVPALSRTEIVGKDGESFQPITINLPNIPKIDLSVGESSPQALPSTPEEEPKSLGEGTPTFQLPKFELSPNVLRDIQEIGEATPTDLSQTPGTGPGDSNESQTGN